MTESLCYTVYKNTKQVLKHRKLELVSGDLLQQIRQKTKVPIGYLSEKEFTTNIHTHKYICLEAKGSSRHLSVHHHSSVRALPTRTYIYVMDEDSSDIKTDDMVKRIHVIPQINSEKRAFNIDMILICIDTLSTHVMKRVNGFRRDGSDGNGFINIDVSLYTPFLYEDFFQYCMMHQHRVIPEAERADYLLSLRLAQNQLPKIFSTDPAAMLIGAVPGDIVEVIRPQENSGEERVARDVL